LYRLKKKGEIFGFDIKKVFLTVRKHWRRLPGDLADTYPRASLGTSSAVSVQ